MKNRLILRAVFLLSPFLTQAQQIPDSRLPQETFSCVSNEMMLSDPKLITRQRQLEDFMLKHSGASAEKGPDALPYVLPVVVHIIHQDGSENIPDAQVFAAVDHLNQAFAHTAYFGQQGDGVNTQIQFCLARRTPDGQLTNGITRSLSPLTDMVSENDDEALKNIIRWDPTNYINIWVVKSITSASQGAGVAGYAFLASAHGQPEDGLVCEAQTFGVDPAQDGVLIHEMGHYLNLYHTFEGGCPNDNCQTGGDRVCDTPPDQATHTVCPYNSCDTDADDPSPDNAFGSDVNDATENFMDYSPFACYRTFSEGQSERMRFAIENFRKSLLESEACKDPCGAPLSAVFVSSATETVAGGTIVFTNQTTGATHFEWYVNGNLEATSVDFSYQFSGTGNFTVTLRAYNSDPNCVGVAETGILVKCDVTAAFSVNAGILAPGEMLVCTNTSTGATGFEWFINGVSVGTTTGLTYPFTTPGFYTVLLQAAGNFCSDQTSFLVEVNAGAPFQEVCDNGLDDDLDGYADCFDPECQCFDGADCKADSLFAAAPIRGKTEWLSPVNLPGINNTPIVANLDPQNGPVPEIIVAEGISDNLTQSTVTRLLIYRGDGSNAAAPDVLEIPERISERSSVPVIGDVDRDGVPELAIVCWDGYIRVYTGFTPGNSPAMALFVKSEHKTEWAASHLGMADFNEDGVTEIYSGNEIFQFDLTDITNPFLTRELKGALHSGSNFANTTAAVAADMLSVVDCNGDPDCGGVELVAGAYIYSVDLDPNDGDGLEIKAARSLNAMEPGVNFLDGYNYVADVNLDGALDVVTAGRHSAGAKAGFYVWDKNGLLGKFINPDPAPIVDPQYFTLSIANVFDDTGQGFQQDFPEILYPSRTKMSCFNLQAAQANPAAPYWWSADSQDQSTAAGPSCFDFNGDGLAEIVYRDEHFLRLMYGGALPLPAGVDAARNWVKIPCNSQTIDEYPVVADVDADGEAEIVVTGYLTAFVAGQPDYRGRLLVIGSDYLPWSPTRAVWNQFSYFGVNVNDDLSIPKHQQAHQLELPGLGSGKRPLNIAHAQWPVFDDQFDPSLPVPDLALSVDSIRCEGGDIRLWIQVCNNGSKTLYDSLPVSFYKNDPRQPGASLAGTRFIPHTLPVDSCYFFSTIIPAVFNGPVYVLANDDGLHALPLALGGFPVTDLPECDYENNLASFTLPFQNPDLDLGPDLSLCGGSTVQLHAGAGFLSYRWQDGSSDATFTAYGPGKYWVEARDLCGVLHSDTLVVSEDQSATIDLGPDLVFCEGPSVPLSVSGFASVQWFASQGLSCTDCASTVITPPAGVTTVYVTAANGNCFASDSLRIFTLNKPELSLTASDGDCSMPAGIFLQVSGTPLVDILWSNGETGSIIHPLTSGTYSVTVNGSVGCGSVDSATVVVDNQPAFTVQPDTLIPASGPATADGSIFVKISGGTEPFSYAWSNGTTFRNLEAVAPGAYSLTVTDGEGCVRIISFNVEFVERPVSPDCWEASILPNPSMLFREVVLPIEVFTPRVIDLRVYDVTGKRLYAERLDLAAGLHLKTLESPTSTGVYMVVLYSDCGFDCLKWVVVE